MRWPSLAGTKRRRAEASRRSALAPKETGLGGVVEEVLVVQV